MTELKNSTSGLVLNDDTRTTLLSQPKMGQATPGQLASPNNTPKSSAETISYIDIDGIQIEMVEKDDKTIYRLPGKMTVNNLDPDKRIHVLEKIEKLHSQQLMSKKQLSQKKLKSKSNINLRGLSSSNSTPQLNRLDNSTFLQSNPAIVANFPPSINSVQSTGFPSIYPITPNLSQTNLTLNKSSGDLSVKPIAIKPRSNFNLSSNTDSFSPDPISTGFSFSQPQAISTFPTPVQNSSTPHMNMNVHPLSFNFLNTPTGHIPLNPTNLQTSGSIGADVHYQNILNSLQTPPTFNSHQSIVQLLLSSFAEGTNPSMPILPNTQFMYPGQNMYGVKDGGFNQAPFTPIFNPETPAPPKIAENGIKPSTLANEAMPGLLKRLGEPKKPSKKVKLALDKLVIQSKPKQATPKLKPISSSKKIKSGLSYLKELKFSQNGVESKKFSPKANVMASPKTLNKIELSSSTIFPTSRNHIAIGKKPINFLSHKIKSIHQIQGKLNNERKKAELKSIYVKRVAKPNVEMWDFGTKIKPVNFEDNHRSHSQAEHLEKVKRKFVEVLHADQRASTNPITNSPFENPKDVIQRLLPYHIYQGCQITDGEVKAYQELINKSSTTLAARYDKLRLRISKISSESGSWESKPEPELSLMIESKLLEGLKSSALKDGCADS